MDAASVDRSYSNYHCIPESATTHHPLPIACDRVPGRRHCRQEHREYQDRAALLISSHVCLRRSCTAQNTYTAVSTLLWVIFRLQLLQPRPAGQHPSTIPWTAKPRAATHCLPNPPACFVSRRARGMPPRGFNLMSRCSRPIESDIGRSDDVQCH